MMSLANILIIASCLGMSHGMTCEWPGTESNALDRFIHSCPGITDKSENSYCCVDPLDNGKFKCCSFIEFAITYIIIIAIVVAVMSILCSIVCCCCCPCCCLYKRRHGNVV